MNRTHILLKCRLTGDGCSNRYGLVNQPGGESNATSAVMRKMLEQMLNRNPLTQLSIKTMDVERSREVRERLQELGYIE
ncbi:MAG: hypothetical protein ABEJ66_03850 [Candidatus Nanohaloarchaea archaeon]